MLFFTGKKCIRYYTLTSDKVVLVQDDGFELVRSVYWFYNAAVIQDNKDQIKAKQV